MSAFFNSSNGVQSPPRRPIVQPSAISPFSTSPSQLQEVTLNSDESYSYTMGLHPSNGPFRGRSIKEIDDLVSNLRKENFNLKLRIYFLEERMGTNFNLDKENAIKKNIELMVEVESLKKELIEKQELLCQAVKAMELEEEENKKEMADKDRKIATLQGQLENLQQKYDLFQDEIRCQGDGGLGDPFGGNRRDGDLERQLGELDNKVKQLEDQLEREKNNSRQLENLLQLSENRTSTISTLEAELKRKEESFKRMNCELDDRNRVVESFHARISALEDDIMERQREVDYLKRELEEKSSHVQELQLETEEFHKIAAETHTLYEAEKRKGERHKTSIIHRNAKIVELENLLEKARAKVASLEGRLEAAAHNEVKSKNVEARSPQKSHPHNTNVDPFLVHGKAPTVADLSSSPKKTSSLSQLRRSTSVSSSEHQDVRGNSSGALNDSSPSSNKSVDQLQHEVNKSRKQILKLEQDQLKACRIIQSMLDKQKKNEGKLREMQNALQRKDSQVKELSEQLHKVSVRSEGNGARDNALVSVADRANTASDARQHTNALGDNENSMAEANEDPKLLLEQYKELTDNLEEQKKVLMSTLEETKHQMNELETKYHVLQEDLKTKENRIVDLEFELLSLAQGITSETSMGEKSDVGNEKPSNFFISEIEDKDKEIERLEGELRKRTCDLQGIVNKELWEKNREIEKLQKRYGDIIANKDGELAKLGHDLAGKTDQLELLKSKISELGLDVNSLDGGSNDAVLTKEKIKEVEDKLREVTKERDWFKGELDKRKINTELDRLQEEHAHLQGEMEKCEKLRAETNEVCSILTTRLEELAYFLDSLLRQKSILGFLGQSKNEQVRRLIHQSLDISRTLTHSLTMDPDQSLIQLSNITTILNLSQNDSIAIDNTFMPVLEADAVLSVIPANISLTYQSHLYPIPECKNEQSRIITALRNQIDTLKREIEIRDTELNKIEVKSDNVTLNVSGDKSNNTSTTLKYHSENQSESESWSEPDRSVSKARIGLDECLKPRRAKIYETSTVSTEGENDKSPSKSSSRKSILAENRQTIISLHEQISDLENLVKMKENELEEAKNLIEKTEKALAIELKNTQDAEMLKADLLRQIRDTEDKLESSRLAKEEAEVELDALRSTILDVKASQKLLQETLEIKNKETENRMDRLELEKRDLQDQLKLAEEAVKTARENLEVSRRQLERLGEESKLAEERIDREWEQRMRIREEDFEAMMRTLENRAESEIQKLMESARELQAKYEAECVKRDEVDKLMATIKELEKVRKVVKVAEDQIHTLEESEENLKRQLHESEVEYRNKVNTLRQELERTNLLYSESLLEKSKILNEKAELDRQIKEFAAKESEFTRQVREYKDDFEGMKDNFQKQLARVENQKSRLEIRVSQLEQSNADLKNKLVKMQSGDQSSLSRSAPNSSSRILDMFLNKTCPPAFKRQHSDYNSGYNSEDAAVIMEGCVAAQKPFNPALDLVPIDAERQQSNSSPDLGIESDHGRFSSLEMTVNVNRPFLKTLELTESMSNLLDKDGQQLLQCNNEQCCLKTKEIVNENTDLRKRLLRTRRALEDTVSQLTIANQRKKQVEKTICKQIHKTSQVLRKAKANLDSGSENDAAAIAATNKV